ncbi:MAG: hypothetical protein AAF502_06940 [Bacteroidota bacterium]
MNLLDVVFKKDLPELTVNKLFGWIGHIFFLLMILGCIIYAPERMLDCDAGYYSFHVINTENYFVIHDRYINFIMQTPTIMAIKIGGGLGTVLATYSATGFALFYLLFIILYHGLRNSLAAILLVLGLCLTMRYKHYAGHTEITVAIAFSIMLFGWMSTDKSKLKWFKSWMHWPGLFLICFLLYGIHPIIVVPVCMILGADILMNNRWKDWPNWISLVIVIATFVMRFMTQVLNSEYESGKVSMMSSSQDVLLNWGKYPVVYEIVREYFTNQYFLIVPIFLLAIILLLVKRKWLTAPYLLSSAVILLAVVIVSHFDLRSRLLFIFDGYIGMLGTVFGLGILYGFKPWFNKLWFHLLLVGLIALSVIQIHEKHNFFENRLKAMDKTFEMNDNHPKLFVELKDFNWENMWYPYEVPLESLIWTSLRGKEHGKTIYVDASKYRTTVDVDAIEGFYGFGKAGPLNEKFFDLPEVKYKLTDKVAWKNKK